MPFIVLKVRAARRRALARRRNRAASVGAVRMATRRAKGTGSATPDPPLTVLRPEDRGDDNSSPRAFPLSREDSRRFLGDDGLPVYFPRRS